MFPLIRESPHEKKSLATLLELLAEQALRMMKVKMKISGAFRTFKGAADFAALRSVVATARKQGWNILHTLTAQPHALIQALSA